MISVSVRRPYVSVPVLSKISVWQDCSSTAGFLMMIARRAATEIAPMIAVGIASSRRAWRRRYDPPASRSGSEFSFDQLLGQIENQRRSADQHSENQGSQCNSQPRMGPIAERQITLLQ
jgi:hypothetical protein